MRRDSAKPPHDVERVAERACVADRRPGGNHAEIVTDDVRYRERATRAGRARRQPSTFDCRQMLAHGIQRVNVGASAEQDLCRPPFVVERHVVRRHGHQRRRAAREQHQQDLVDGQCSSHRERAPSGALAVGGRQRMSAGHRLERRRTRLSRQRLLLPS